jgi:ABC-type proline/glycine betaine transport system ATPase subunit
VPLLSKRQGQMCQVEETRANIQLEIKIEAIIQITILFMTFDEQTAYGIHDFYISMDEGSCIYVRKNQLQEIYDN